MTAVDGSRAVVTAQRLGVGERDESVVLPPYNILGIGGGGRLEDPLGMDDIGGVLEEDTTLR